MGTQSEWRPSLYEYNRNAPNKSLKKENISSGRSWKLWPQLKKACLWKSLMTIIIPSLEDSHSSINIAFTDRGSRTPQASGLLFITAAADAFIYLPQERGSSVYMPCVLLIYSVLCLCLSGGGSEWDTEGAVGSPAVPAVPLSCVWSSELEELIMDWFKVCQHKPRGPETAPCAAHTPAISIAHTHTGI